MTDGTDIDTRPDDGEARDEDELLGGELRSLLASLPREIAPERDLLAEIAARTWDRAPGSVADRVRSEAAGETAARRASRGPVPGAGRRWWLAAAAALLVVVSSTLTVLVMRTTDGTPSRVADGTEVTAPPAPETAFAGLAVGEEVRLAATQYETAVADLRAVLDRNRDALSPGTMEIVEENLEVLDSALRETVEALRAAPGDAQLRHTMVAAYERKLDFLRQAVALTAEI